MCVLPCFALQQGPYARHLRPCSQHHQFTCTHMSLPSVLIRACTLSPPYRFLQPLPLPLPNVAMALMVMRLTCARALQAEGRYDAGSQTYTLRLKQATPPTPGQPTKQPVLIPVAVGLLGPDGGCAFVPACLCLFCLSLIPALVCAVPPSAGARSRACLSCVCLV